MVILDGGDMFQGTLVSNTFRGKSVVEAYNQIGITDAREREPCRERGGGEKGAGRANTDAMSSSIVSSVT